MGRTFGNVQKVLPWPRPRWTGLHAIHQNFCRCWAQDRQNFCKSLQVLPHDGQNFQPYIKSSALAWPKTGRTFCNILKVLPWPGPRLGELLALDQKICRGLAQDGQNFSPHIEISALALPKMGRSFGHKALVWQRMGRTFRLHTKSSAMARHNMGRTFRKLRKFLP